MPLYEYKCVKCGHRFEKIENVGAPEIKKCPKCKGKAERQFAAPAIQFKGSGWYVTDYAGKNSGAASGESGDTGTSKTSDKPGDSKPAVEKSGKESGTAAKKK